MCEYCKCYKDNYKTYNFCPKCGESFSVIKGFVPKYSGSNTLTSSSCGPGNPVRKTSYLY